MTETIESKYEETIKISNNIEEGLEEQVKRIREDLVTLPEEIVGMVKSGNSAFIIDDKL